MLTHNVKTFVVSKAAVQDLVSESSSIGWLADYLLINTNSCFSRLGWLAGLARRSSTPWRSQLRIAHFQRNQHFLSSTINQSPLILSLPVSLKVKKKTSEQRFLAVAFLFRSFMIRRETWQSRRRKTFASSIKNDCLPACLETHAHALKSMLRAPLDCVILNRLVNKAEPSNGICHDLTGGERANRALRSLLISSLKCW